MKTKPKLKPATLPTAEQLEARLNAISDEPGRRGWKTAFLDQHAGRIEPALKRHTYEQVAAAISELGVSIAPATISNWSKSRRRDDSAPGAAERPVVKKVSGTSESTSQPPSSPAGSS